MEIAYWIVTLGLAAILGLMVTVLMEKNKEMGQRDQRIWELDRSLANADTAWRELKASMTRDDPLVAIAMEYVKAFDAESQSGEWKYHQAYAAMLKDKRIINHGFEKWKIGVAIHDALREIRTQ